MSRRISLLVIFLGALVLGVALYQPGAASSVPVVDDPLVRMPGTQPNQVSLESPNRCLNCHAGYNTAVEPGFNWQGSMMAQSARDFLFWSAMTVAAQDSIWAIGRPNATDLCERCHFPKGWLEGRSDPTNASLMTGADYDGVQCDFCHSLYDPFFEDTHQGARKGESGYWDETNASGTPSQPAANATYAEDAVLSQALQNFNGTAFFQNNRPHTAAYDESGGGQYFVSGNGEKRASFADAEARHQMLYSRYHKSKYFCSTCHDVSNPALANLALDGTLPGDGTTILPSEEQPAYSYFHVERTFSEFMLSAYGRAGGAEGLGPFAPATFETSDPNNWITTCQDCHMRDVVGAGADKRGVPVRPGDSVEHPNSGQPLHDMTGGNVWVSTVLASAVSGSPNYDATNAELLNRPDLLTLDLSQGQGINPEALLAGADRARQQLQMAATIADLTYDAGTGSLNFKVQNQTGHRLISGFPEGRRMFLNIQVSSGGQLYEINPYDEVVGTLKGFPDAAPLGANEIYSDTLVYEMHPSSSLTGEDETFHFVLADGRYKDNRIPPQGYDIANAAARQAEPVAHGESAPDYYTAEEYAGGYDAVSLQVPAGADSVTVSLYYQTTSREYISFLRDQIRGTATTLTDKDGVPAYVVQTDPFFDRLRAWGDTIWQLWSHTKDWPGAAPVLMAQATVGGDTTSTCPDAPLGLTATAGHTAVSLSWEAAAGAETYNLYYDQADKAQLVATGLTGTAYVDSGLTNGQTYCYKVTSATGTCESGYSDIVCATPAPQQTAVSSVDTLATGYYAGKGNNATFTVAASFTAGDEIVMRALVVDSGGQPLAGAVVELAVEEAAGGVLLSTGPSDAQGIAEATWKTDAPKGNKSGTASGTYTAAVRDVTLSGYTWDGTAAKATFTIQ